MPTQIQMPKLGLTMQEGKVTEWVVAAGTPVTRGTVVMLIETDKVEAEVEAEADGIVSHVAAVGEVLEPGEIVGWLLAEGEHAPGGAAPDQAATVEASSEAPSAPTEPSSPAATATPAPSSPVGEGGRILASPAAKKLAAARGVDLGSLAGSGPGGRVVLADVEGAGPAAGGRLRASPNAKRIAAQRGVDLLALTGSGPGGRIVSEDVLAAGDRPSPVPAPPPTAGAVAAPSTTGDARGRFIPFVAARAAEKLGVEIAEVVGSGPDGRVSRADVYAHAQARLGSGPVRRVGDPAAASGPRPGDRLPVSGMRAIIGERMHASLAGMAQLTLAMDVDMDRVVELRNQLVEIGADELGAVPGYTDFVIAAAAQALRRHPIVNSQLVDGHIEVLEQVNVGMAVAVEDGLMVPVIGGTDQLALADLALETSRLAKAARDKRLGLGELEGGTFSVTTLGMFGVDMFTPVINPPNSAILGVGRIRDDVGWVGDAAVRVKRMTLSLTWDHRVFDGAPAADFAQTVKEFLEQPLRLL